MSTDLRNVPNVSREISQTRSWGGDTFDGVTITIGMRNPCWERGRDSFHEIFESIRINRHEAKELAKELMLFADSEEVEEFKVS